MFNHNISRTTSLSMKILKSRTRS